MKTSGSRKAIYAFTAPSSQKNKDPKDGKNERNKCFPKDFMYLRALITNKYKANMGNFFKSLFSFSSSDNNSKEGEATAQAKNEEKNFDILKFDGMRAHQMGKLAYAIKCYTEALAIKSDAEILNLLASAYSAKGDMPKAEDAINRLIALDPSNMQNRLARVHMLFAQGKEADVVTDCDAIIEQDPENAAAYFMRGKAKRILGGKLNAGADLTKAITLQPDFGPAFLMRSELLLMMGQGKEALDDANQAVKLMPEEEVAYLLRGRLHGYCKQWEAAQADFEQVQALNPFNEEAQWRIGQLLTEQNKLDEALAYFDEMIEEEPNRAWAYSERGRIRNLKGDKEGAMADLKKTIELNPNGPEAQRMNGEHSNK